MPNNLANISHISIWLSYRVPIIAKTSKRNPPYSNAALLRQILAKGVDSWKPSETGHIDGKSINTRPLTNRELMNQLLDQAEAGPS